MGWENELKKGDRVFLIINGAMTLFIVGKDIEDLAVRCARLKNHSSARYFLSTPALELAYQKQELATLLGSIRIDETTPSDLVESLRVILQECSDKIETWRRT